MDNGTADRDGQRAQALRIHTLALGPMDNLVYLVEEIASRRAAIIDPAWDCDEIVRLLDGRGLTLTDVLVTHGHDDHVNALGRLLALWPAAQVHTSPEEAAFWREASSGSLEVRPPEDRRSEVWAAPPPARLRTHAGDETIELGSLGIEVVVTPGHSPGGICYRVRDHLFTGDTLFVYGCGRCDLAGSDPRRMYRSLRTLAERVADEVLIHPGHRYAPWTSSTMAEQRRANPFLHVDAEDDFVAFRAEHNRHRMPPYGPVPRGQRIW